LENQSHPSQEPEIEQAFGFVKKKAKSEATPPMVVTLRIICSCSLSWVHLV
jgi:hypothetical protein